MKSGIMLLTITALVIACSKETPEITNPTLIEYKVTVTSGNWYGEYISETGEKICFCKPPLPASGWTYSFEVSEKPFTLHIDATAEVNLGKPEAPDVTTSIYVDNILVVSNTSNWAPGVASSDYVVR